MAASALAIAAAALAPWTVASAQQNSPNSFQLPEPSPTPTPAPQGPVDVRAGVPIGPRSIPSGTPAPTTAPAPTPTPTPTASSPTPGTQTPAPSTTSSPASTDRPATNAPPSSSVPASAGQPSELPATDDTATEPTGVPSPASPAATLPPPIATPNLPSGASNSFGPQAQEASGISTYWPWAIGLIVLLLGAGAFLRWRSGRTRVSAPLQPSELGAAPAGVAPQPAPQLDLSLEIISATRSVMMFTLEYRISLANRTDRAVRDLNLSAQLASAQRGASNAPAIAGIQQLDWIDRIAPHQSRSLTGKMQIPLSDLRPILQGAKPIFIPILHVTLDVADEPAFKRSFVVGTPSEASQGRLHPIALDTPPGGLPGLRAHEVQIGMA